MKILVTGGAGFIGSHIVDRFIDMGHSVTVLDNLSTGRREFLNPKAEFIEADVSQPATVEIVTSIKPDIVDHHAAQIDVRRSVSEPAFDAAVNVVGSINVMEAAVRCGARKFIFASSGGAVYGEQDSFPASENHSMRPVSQYGAAKMSVEAYLGCYRAIYGMPYVALRYANVYGPRQNPLGEAGVVAIFSHKMLAAGEPVIYGDGGQTRDFVYVGDVADANARALETDFCGSVNIGTGRELSVDEIFRFLAELCGYRGAEVHAAAKKGEQRRSSISPGVALDVLGWKPLTPVEAGLAKTVEYFKMEHSAVGHRG